MLFKTADDKTPHIEALTALLDRPDVDAALRKRIEFEIKICRAGMRGEAEAAYEIDFHYKATENWAVIHDLRIEVEGRVAQIDHLILNRMLECYVLETKHFSEGLSINDHGEFVRFYGSKPTGIPSPIEQNHKHISVLQALLASSAVPLPTRLGIALRPNCKSLILVSANARITRPKKEFPGMDELVKTDQLMTRLDKELEKGSVLKIVSPETLHALARQIVAQHKPAQLAVAARFGLPEVAPVPKAAPAKATHVATAAPRRAAAGPTVPAPAPVAAPAQVAPAAAPVPSAPTAGKTTACEACAGPLTPAEARFCRFNKPKFSNRLLCRNCQQAVG